MGGAEVWWRTTTATQEGTSAISSVCGHYFDHYLDTTPLHHYTTTSLHHYITTPLHHSVISPRGDSSPLRDFITQWHSATTSLHHSGTSQLWHYTTQWLHHRDLTTVTSPRSDFITHFTTSTGDIGLLALLSHWAVISPDLSTGLSTTRRRLH